VTVPDPTAPECTELKPEELRPPGLSIELPSDVDPEPVGDAYHGSTNPSQYTT
jgi:hypothetical protein